MTDEQRARCERLELMIAQLELRLEARRAREAKLYPDRPLAKVLEFKPRTAS